MAEARLCPQCQSPLPVDAPHNLCPKCLFQEALSEAENGVHDSPGTGAYQGPFSPPSARELG